MVGDSDKMTTREPFCFQGEIRSGAGRRQPCMASTDLYKSGTILALPPTWWQPTHLYSIPL